MYTERSFSVYAGYNDIVPTTRKESIFVVDDWILYPTLLVHVL